MFTLLIELIQSICLIVASIIIVITAIGILHLDDEMDKVIYVRIHMLGMVDIACVLAMIGLGQILLGLIYFVLAPFVVHAMANAYYYGEDERKYETSDKISGRIDDTTYNEIILNKNRDKNYNSKQSSENSTISSSKIIKPDNNVIKIKEVGTDDIENSSLNKDGVEKHD